ncbi:MAG: glycosyl transferase group 1 [Parcubacteria group bacterium Gr01-1014_2]|nr:MAG: glycosyl transferase group 1 [Parcubacteria group bacterium Gr01-1014_2]
MIAFHKIFPEAPIYTLFYDKEFVSQYLPKAKITPSFLHKVPNIKKLHPWLKILMPAAIESFDLSDFDLIISSSHEFSHGVLSKQSAKHICFYHSPSRILWDRTYEYARDFKERGKGAFKLSLIKLGQHFLRIWDHGASQRPDVVLANSKHVAQRIKKYYGREAKVIYPPVTLSREHLVREKPLGYSHLGNTRPHTTYIQNLSPVYQNKPSLLVRLAKRIPPLYGSAREVPQWLYPAGFSFRINTVHRTTLARLADYFLIVSQLYPHKNIDLAVEAFKHLPSLNLLIIGEGPEYKNLKSKIKKLKLRNVELLGFVSDEDLPVYYKGCLAYLICNEEDFGISPIEAMSFGKPVLAYKKGGAKESVLEGKTGEFFDKLEPDCLSEAVELITEKIKNGHFNELAIKKHSEKFSFERFKKEVFDIIKFLDYNLA